MLFYLAQRAREQSPAPTQRAFETPDEAAKAFVAALKTGENAPLVEIFGAKHRDLIGTVDAARDRELRGRLAKMAEDRQRLRVNEDGSVTMVVGYEAWPFPIPLVKTDAGWRFNTDAGFEEVLKRRIGENELTAIATLRAYVEAQRQYAAEPRDGTEVRQFAQKLQSSPGKKDGLYWPADASKGEQPSPGGPEIKDSKTPYAGYYFKILTAQGATAPGGKYSYIINGHLIGGFAMIAWPADYGKTGVMTSACKSLWRRLSKRPRSENDRAGRWDERIQSRLKLEQGNRGLATSGYGNSKYDVQGRP